MGRLKSFEAHEKCKTARDKFGVRFRRQDIVEIVEGGYKGTRGEVIDIRRGGVSGTLIKIRTEDGREIIDYAHDVKVVERK